jgi:tetratricopeptide (TPR) repeat protein
MHIQKILVVGLVLLVALTAPFQSEAQRRKKRGNSLSVSDSLRSIELFQDGVKMTMIDDPKRALEYFEQSQRISPDNAGLMYAMAKAYSDLNDKVNALNYAKRALDIDKTNPYYYLMVAKAYEDQKEYKDAAKIYEELIENIPNSNEHLFDLANAYLRVKNFKQALQTMEKIEKVYGLSEEVVRQKQQVYFQMNKMDLAIKEMRKLIEANPFEVRYKLILAELLMSNKMEKDAEQLLNQILARETNSYASLMLYSYHLNANNRAKAESFLEAPLTDPDLNIDEKVRVLAQYLGGYKNDEEATKVIKWAGLIVKAHPEEAKAWAFQGDFLNLNKQKREARTSYLKSLSIMSSNQQVWEQVVLIGSELNEIDSVAKHSELALESFPTNGIMWFYKGRANLFQKKNQEAANALEAAKKYQSENAGLVFESNAMLGDIYNDLKQYKKSDASYEDALIAEPNSTPVLNNYSYYLSVRKDKLALAKKMGEKLVELDSENPTYQDTYGWILYQLKEYEKAKEWLEKAALKTGDATVIEHLGDVYFKLGLKEKALEKWRAAKLNGADNPENIQKKINAGALLD